MSYIIALDIVLDSGQRLVYRVQPDQESVRKAITHILRQAQDKEHPVNYEMARHIIDGIRDLRRTAEMRTMLETKRGDF